MTTPLVTIGALPVKTDVEDGNWLIVDDGGVTKKINITDVAGIEEPVADAHIADAVGAHAATAISAIAPGTPLVSNTVQGLLNDTRTALVAGTTALTAHLTDTVDAHDASAISIPADSVLTGTDVQTQLQQANDAITTLTTADTTLTTDLAIHITDTTDAHAASTISFTPVGTISATTVQAAIAEVAAEAGSGGGGGGGAVSSVNGQIGAVVLDAADVGADAAGTALNLVNVHISDATAAHAASAIAYTPGGTVVATTVQAAIAEVATDAAAALVTHEADQTSVHGIANTALLVVTSDPRLTDARTPASHASSHALAGADQLSLDGTQIVTGLVADARIASTIARDTEVTAAVSNHTAATDPHGDRAYAATLVDDLSGVTNAATARTNLGLGLLATLSDVAWIYMPSGSVGFVNQLSSGAWGARPTNRVDVRIHWEGYPGLTSLPSGAFASDKYFLAVP